MLSWCGAVRCVYNLALEQRKTWGRSGRNFNYANQGKEVTQLRSEFEWLADAPADVLHQALRDLDKAYRAFWDGRTGYPKFRRRGKNDTFRVPKPTDFSLRRISRHVGEIRIPKIGPVRVRWDKDLPGQPKSLTISNRGGIWAAAVQCECNASGEPGSSAPLGIDRGIVAFASLSTGEIIAPASAGKAAAAALARAQRKLARQKKGSNNRKKQVLRVARLHARIRRTRSDFLHKLSTRIAKNHGEVVIEKLDVRNMVRSAKGTVAEPGRNVRQKSGLNRSILDQGWGEFRRMLAYKLDERGGLLTEVNPAYTSQTCSACGVIDAASRNGQRFACTSCGHEAHADTNAAINILAARHAVTACGGIGRKAPREAGTIRAAA